MMKHLREPGNTLTHFAGTILAAVGVAWLAFLTRSDLRKLAVMLIFGVSMISLYASSTVYHFWNGSEKVIQWLRRVDHAAIYIMIAGSYTPFIYAFLSGTWQWTMLGIIWGMAAVGVIFKLFFFRAGHLSTLYYLAMGWVAVIIAPKVLPIIDPGAAWLLAGGGLVYTVGAVIFAMQKPNFHHHFGHHELWHLFVIAGSVLHFSAIRLYVI